LNYGGRMRVPVVAVVAVALVVVACKSEQASSSAKGEPSAQAPVKECEEYAAKMEACLGKMKPEERAEEEPAFRATKDAWKDQKDRAALAKSCKGAMASLPSSCK